jgi:glycosyltransferase involved in cell wall biosynthesis
MKEQFYPPVSVIVPAYNEEKAVGQQVNTVREVLSGRDILHEIIVVDDGSHDSTSTAAMKAGARLLRHPENRGYGASLKAGINAASYETIVIIDADGTYPASEIPVMLEKLEHADMVVGSRTGSNVHIPWVRQPAKWLLRILATRIAEQPIPDLNSGLRAFRRECVKQYFPVLSNRFSFTTTVTLSYLADQYRLVYHPINYFPRVGKSKIVPWHFMDFLILILRMSMMFNPLKVFIPLALLMGGLGVLKTVYDVWALFARTPGGGLELLLEPVLSTSAVLLLFVGLQLLILGMVADGVVRRIAQHNRPQAPSHGYMNFEVVLPNQAGQASYSLPIEDLPVDADYPGGD